MHARKDFVVASLLTAYLRGEVREVGVGEVAGGAADGGAGLGDEAAHDGVLGVGIGVLVDGHAAGRLAEEDHLVWVAAEGGDVGVGPFDGFALVEEAWVEVSVVEGGGVGEAEDVQAVAGGVRGAIEVEKG